ncbi:zinc finger protein OZF-like [Lutzomyia longipalpis]|uniref:zinc finger protein OZF-like n=1 Tax=Lutzomyia longipalpis TaxID=7200 RepID=UPI00248424FE|nr:zinc finger protein OZF-like [Lutzomyia longipalpis]
MGSLENPLIQCHAIRDLLKRIDRIYGELIDHENTLPKCEICWENRTEFVSVKTQLYLIVQESNLSCEKESRDILYSNEFEDDADTVDPVTMVVVKEEQKTEIEDDDDTQQNDMDDDRDNEWNPWENKKSTTTKKTKRCKKVARKSTAAKEETSNAASSDSTKKQFECGYCSSVFNQKSQIISHMRLHVKNFSKVKTKSTVAKTLENSEDRTCKICQKRVHTLSGLKRHMKFHEKKKESEPPVKSDNQEAQYPCDICQKGFRYAGALDRHKEFRDSAHLVCDMCNEKFCTNSDLMNHQRIVHKINSSFQCRYCDEQFNNFRLIIKHHKLNHPTELAPESPFLCEMCGAVMMDQRDLNYHMRRLHESKRFKCDMCRRTFRLQTELKEHQRIHIPISQLKDLYECDVCPKKFRIKSSLLKHKKLHTGQTVEMFCTVCRKRFINANSLELHMAKHANEGPRFKCECGKTFTKLKYLNQHRKDDHNIFTHLMLNPKSKKKC